MLDPNYANDVLEFHRAAGAHIGEKPELPPGQIPYEKVLTFLNAAKVLMALPSQSEGRMSVRLSFILEEFIETIEAARDGNLPEFFDGILDLLYVVVGLGISSGLPMNVGWEIVHSANMAKVADGVIENQYGKIMKPPGWVPPQQRLAEVLARWGGEACEALGPVVELLPAEDPEDRGESLGPTEIDGHDVRTIHHPPTQEERDEPPTGGGLFGRRW